MNCRSHDITAAAFSVKTTPIMQQSTDAALWSACWCVQASVYMIQSHEQDVLFCRAADQTDSGSADSQTIDGIFGV